MYTKTMGRKRIRRLVPKAVVKKSKSLIQSIWFGTKIIVALAVSVAMLSTIQYGNFIEELRHLSLNQYHLYVHGRSNYCQERFGHTNITRELRHRLGGQDSVISAIESSFERHENHTAIALIGPQGVGKTLTLNVIEKEFQWPSNVLRYIWSSIQSQQSQLKRLNDLLAKLSSCGQNAILVDNVLERDLPIIDEFQQILEAYIQQHRLKVFIFYVIQETSPNADDDKPVQVANITSIHYRRFDASDLANCISIECARLNVKLSQTEIDEIVRNIDVTQTGCKTVLAKIARVPNTKELTD